MEQIRSTLERNIQYHNTKSSPKSLRPSRTQKTLGPKYIFDDGCLSLKFVNYTDSFSEDPNDIIHIS